MAKLVRGNSGEHDGKIGLTWGAHVARQVDGGSPFERSGNWIAALAGSETALSWTPHQNYDLSLAGGLMKGTLEGNLRAVVGPAAIGLTHGIGAGFQVDRIEGEKDRERAYVDFLGGVLSEFAAGDEWTIFLGARYSLSEVFESGPSDGVGTMQQVNFSTGCLFELDGFQVTPELGVTWQLWRDEEEGMSPEETTTWIIFLGATVAAPF